MKLSFVGKHNRDLELIRAKREIRLLHSEMIDYLLANYPEYLYTLHFSFTLFAAMVIY